MLPRDKVEQERLFAKIRREISIEQLVKGLNRELRLGRRTINPEKPLLALPFIRNLEGAKNVAGLPDRYVLHAYRWEPAGHCDPEMVSVLAEINAILATYSSSPQVFQIDEHGVWQRRRMQRLHEMWEELMISKIIDLAELGELHRLRNCARCERWFFSRLPRQKCCNKTCGQLQAASDPEKRSVRNAKRQQNRISKKKQELAQVNAKLWPAKWTREVKGTGARPNSWKPANQW